MFILKKNINIFPKVFPYKSFKFRIEQIVWEPCGSPKVRSANIKPGLKFLLGWTVELHAW